MVVRRIGAYLIDLLIFIIVLFGSQYLGVILAKNIFGRNHWFLNLIVIVPLIFIVLFICFGIVSKVLKGSIGKNIFDLKVSATNGWITPLRLFTRDIFGKYLIFLPLTIGMIKFFAQPIENKKVAFIYLNITLVLIGILLVVNGVSYLKDKLLFVDNYFDTNVENDIPTAVEYSDILEFKNNK